jgi:D-aminoacyl-tRNA deacylase
MKALIQRVSEAKVIVKNTNIGEIQQGLLIFLGVSPSDTPQQVAWLANKLANLRIFNDEQEKMNLSLQDVKGEALIVSQFTLYGNCEKGRRPSFINAAQPPLAKSLYLEFIEKMKPLASKVATGEFGANMQVELVNEGPVTFIVEAP